MLHRELTLPRIVIIERNPDTCDLLGELFSALGVSVRCFTLPLDALQEIPFITPDVIITSIILKGMSGFQLCQRIRRMHGVSRSYIIALTGLNISGVESVCKDAGFDEYMLKPTTREMIERIVRLASERRNQRHAV